MMCSVLGKRLCLFGFLVAAIEPVSAQQAAGRKPPEPPTMTAIRADEDYSYLRDPANRSGKKWERLKYVPLGEIPPNGTGDMYLSFGDEIRFRYESYENNVLGIPEKPGDNYLRFRAMPYVDLHLGSNFRVFAQLIAAWSTRSDELKTPVADETSVDFIQGFVDWRLPLSNAATLTFRGGRQVLTYGSQRLLSFGPNVRTSFDGGLVRWERDEWRVDAIYAQPVLPEFDWFDDRTDHSRAVWSLYATRMLPQFGAEGAFDLYFVGYENDAAAFHAGTEQERRHTVGTRYAGGSGPHTWDLEGKFQFGDFGDDDIRAWSFNIIGRHTFLAAETQPFIELQTNVTSGDDDLDDDELGTYNAMFPIAEFFGDIGLFGPGNIANFRSIVGFQPSEGLILSGVVNFFWRQQLDDGIYGSSLNPLQAADGSRERDIGVITELTADWELNRHLSFRFNYSFFEPGDFMEDVGTSQTIHYFMAHLVFKY